MAQRLGLVVVLVVAGVLLGTLGTFSLPAQYGISYIWPGVVVQTAGSIWFGGWGMVAGTLFPIVTNVLTGGGAERVLGFIPGNLVQTLIPALAFRRFGVEPEIAGTRGVLFFLFWGALLPNAVGGALGVGALWLFGEVTTPEHYARLWFTWARANVVTDLVLGIPSLRVLTPFWRESGLLVRGFWR